MRLDEIYALLGLHNIKLTAKLITPVRNGEDYKEGEVMGFKPGVYGAKKTNHTTGPSGQIKSSKVLVVYNVFDFGKKQHSDWVDADNCEFEMQRVQDGKWMSYMEWRRKFPNLMNH